MYVFKRFVFCRPYDSLYCGSQISAHAYSVVNRELENLDSWLACNRLSFNIKKPSYKIFPIRSKVINNLIVIRVVQFHVLIMLDFYVQLLHDNQMNFSVHIENVCNKIAKSYGIMNILSKIMPCHVLIFLPVLDVFLYNVWGSKMWCILQTGVARL